MEEGDRNLIHLSVVDESDGSATPLSELSDTIKISDFPEGLDIRAEVTDSTRIDTVVFKNSAGFTHTERQVQYDMYSTQPSGKMPNPTPGVPLYPLNQQSYCCVQIQKSEFQI